MGYDLNDDFEIEVSIDGRNWSRVTDGPSLDAAIKLAKGKIFVRVAKKTSGLLLPVLLSGSVIGGAAVIGFLLAKKQ